MGPRVRLPAMSDNEDLLYSLEGGIARVTLNRPDAANALTPDQRNRIIELFNGFSEDLNVRVVVLTATGKHFCTGADLRVSKVPDYPKPEGAPERTTLDVGRNIKRGAQRLVTAIMDCEKPVVCAVNGTAAGIGVHIALACDMVVASDKAKFIEVFARRGISPDGGGAYLLPRLIGLNKAKELIFLADDLRAEEAERIGLINKVVPADELQAAVDDWATRLAKAPTKALSLAKMLLNRSLDGDRTSSLEDEAWAQDLCSTTEDFKEGVAAFVERREVNFQGW